MAAADMTRATGRPRALDIGPVIVEPPLVLAPMAGVTTPAFRLLCRRAGAGLVCGQLISAHGLAQRNRRTTRLTRTLPGEHPVSLQLFGRDVGLLRNAVPVLVAAGADVVDFNVGCAVRKVLATGAGAALLAEPVLLERIVQALVEASTVPVTVKMRAGLREGDDFVDIARRIEGAGASAIALHARPGNKRRRGRLDWGAIRAVKEAVRIPVIGNGGIRGPGDALGMLRETGCDGAMVGRAAIGQPWLFGQITHEMAGQPWPGVSDRLKVALALWHAQAQALADGEWTALRAMRMYGTHYTRGMPGAAALRYRLSRVASLTELRDLLCDHMARYS
jgi:tRNA-dihydrouridine synthase B